MSYVHATVSDRGSRYAVDLRFHDLPDRANLSITTIQVSFFDAADQRHGAVVAVERYLDEHPELSVTLHDPARTTVTRTGKLRAEVRVELSARQVDDR